MTKSGACGAFTNKTRHTLSGACGTFSVLVPARANRANNQTSRRDKIHPLVLSGACGAFLHYDLSARMHTQEAFIQKSRHMRHMRHPRHPAVTR